MEPQALIIAFLLLLLLAPAVSRRLCCLLGLIRPNFRGERIPAAIGITFLVVTAGMYALLAAGSPRLADRASLFLMVSVGFGLLGLADDRWGSRAVGGFRGHLRALLRGRPTTGGVKLLGGGLLALAAAWLLRGPRPEMLLDASLIALAANGLNLLDVRPGRALFGFALLALPTLLAALLRAEVAGALLLLPVILTAVLEWRSDARGRAMMGDTGSNLLGSVAGLAAAATLPLWGRAALLAILIALNAAAERASLSRLIDETPWLRAIDRRLGVR